MVVFLCREIETYMPLSWLIRDTVITKF